MWKYGDNNKIAVKVRFKKNHTENVYKYLIYLHNFKIHKNSGITNEEQNLKVGEKRFPMIPQ